MAHTWWHVWGDINQRGAQGLGKTLRETAYGISNPVGAMLQPDPLKPINLVEQYKNKEITKDYFDQQSAKAQHIWKHTPEWLKTGIVEGGQIAGKGYSAGMDWAKRGKLGPQLMLGAHGVDALGHIVEGIRKPLAHGLHEYGGIYEPSAEVASTIGAMLLTRKGARMIGKLRPSHFGFSTKLEKIKTLPAPPPSTARKLINVTDDVDMPLPVTSKRISGIPNRKQLGSNVTGMLTKDDPIALGRQEFQGIASLSGREYSYAWTGTGRRVGGGLDGQDADPFIFKSGGAKTSSGVSDGLSLRQKLASDMLDIVNNQAQQGTSIVAARKILDNYRRKTTIENEKGEGQTWNGNQQFLEAVNTGERDLGVLGGLLKWSPSKSKSSAIRINLEKQPTNEVRAWIRYRFPNLPTATVEKLVLEHARHNTVGFARIRAIATKESLTPSDWLKELNEGRVLDKYERQSITNEMRKNVGHLFSVKSLLTNPHTAEIQAGLATQGVDLERLHLPATTAFTGRVEDFLENVRGSNLKEHDFNYHLADLMGVPTSWADDLDIFLDRRLGIGNRTLWKEVFNNKQMEKALTFPSSKTKAEALEFYNKEILPLTNMADIKTEQAIWEETFGIS